MKLLLIDVSNLFFRAFFAFPQALRTPDGQPCNAVYGCASIVFNLIASEQPTHIFAAQDLPGKTWRHDALPTYKSGRPPMPDDLRVQLPQVFDLFRDGFGVPLLAQEGFEADDMLASAATQFASVADEILILSADQDLLQLVDDNIFVLAPRHGSAGHAKLDAAAVHAKLGVSPAQVPDYKALAGDSSDKLVGVPGIGPKGAVALLNEFATLDGIFANTDKVKGKKGELLREHEELSRSTRKLADLHCDLQLGCTLDDGRIDKLPDGLMEFLNGISTRNLQRRARTVFGASEITDNQLGMF